MVHFATFLCFIGPRRWFNSRNVFVFHVYSVGSPCVSFFVSLVQPLVQFSQLWRISLPRVFVFVPLVHAIVSIPAISITVFRWFILWHFCVRFIGPRHLVHSRLAHSICSPRGISLFVSLVHTIGAILAIFIGVFHLFTPWHCFVHWPTPLVDSRNHGVFHWFTPRNSFVRSVGPRHWFNSCRKYWCIPLAHPAAFLSSLYRSAPLVECPQYFVRVFGPHRWFIPPNHWFIPLVHWVLFCSVHCFAPRVQSPQ